VRITLSAGGLAVVAVLAAALVAALAAPPSARAADSAAAFFQGKQIRFFTMGSPGGGYDAYTRALGAFVAKELNATVIPTNETGAGGLISMNRTINAIPDGLTILLIGGEGLLTAQLYGLPGVNYDVRKQTWLARLSSEDKVILLGPKSPYRSVAEMQKSERPVLWGASGKTDGNADFSAILAHALGMKSKIIIGYKGSAGMNLAIQNGEVDGRIVSDESARLYGPSSGMRIIATLARKRTEALPDVPTVFEAVKLSDAQARLIDWRAGIAGLGRVVLATPGTPQDRVELLRKTLASIIRNPEFIAQIKKYSLSANYASAQEIDAAVERAMTTLDDKGIAEVRQIALDRYY
jgi:tripartite-type tricarboxylate transporter receptor subunit TctC